ncbi:MAG: HMA2 domain-containing protein [Thermodesulfobacteriota bacterium]
MNVVSSYIHALEGRLRIKIPEVKGDAGKALEVESYLNLLAGLEEVSANPLTGNVLILYNPRLIGMDEIIGALKDLGYLEDPSSRGSGAKDSRGSQEGMAAKLTSAVASSLMEVALTRLVTALI